MKRLSKSYYPLFMMAVVVSQVDAGNESFADKFLGSPLLILVALFIVVFIAFAYHKMRK